MATINAANQNYQNNADGFQLAGGTTPRTLSLAAGNVTLSAGGANTYTMPAATGTLVSRDSTDTLTNKTIAAASNTFTDWPNVAVASITSMASGNTTSTSFVNIPSNNNTVTFTKRYASTKLVVSIELGFFSSVSTGGIEVGVNVAGTDYAVGRRFKNENGGDSVGGIISVTGVAAGSVTATTRVRVSATGVPGTPQFNWDSNFSVGMSVTEAY